MYNFKDDSEGESPPLFIDVTVVIYNLIVQYLCDFILIQQSYRVLQNSPLTCMSYDGMRYIHHLISHLCIYCLQLLAVTVLGMLMFRMRTAICDCLSKKPPSLHVPVFREILFYKIQLKKPALPRQWSHSLSIIVLSYPLAFVQIT